jgi:hypothetical protein
MPPGQRPAPMMARLRLGETVTPRAPRKQDPAKSFRFRRAAVIVAPKAAPDSWHATFRAGPSGLG